MAKLFLDTNVTLDFLGERQPFFDAIVQIISLADQGKCTITVSALSFATIQYILSKYESAQVVKEKLRKFKIICETASLSGIVIDKALESKFKDFEDALQYFSALESQADIIITRNKKDFKEAKLPILSPDEYLKSLA